MEVAQFASQKTVSKMYEWKYNSALRLQNSLTWFDTKFISWIIGSKKTLDEESW